MSYHTYHVCNPYLSLHLHLHLHLPLPLPSSTSSSSIQPSPSFLRLLKICKLHLSKLYISSLSCRLEWQRAQGLVLALLSSSLCYSVRYLAPLGSVPVGQTLLTSKAGESAVGKVHFLSVMTFSCTRLTDCSLELSGTKICQGKSMSCPLRKVEILSTVAENIWQDQFDDYRESTIGAAFLTQTISLDDTTTVKFEIWDTAGQERYKSLAPMYYRNANCAVVVYDITQAVGARSQILDQVLANMSQVVS